MNKLIKELIGDLSTNLAQEFGIREVSRITKILERAAIGWWGKKLDSPEGVKEALEESLLPESTLRDVLSRLPQKEVIELFEKEDPVGLYPIVELGVGGYASEPLYTYQELAVLFGQFIGYLEDNKHSLLGTGILSECLNIAAGYSVSSQRCIRQKSPILSPQKKEKLTQNIN